jgi:hypothetical protein
MGRPADAFNLMREFGLGIKHAELLGYINTDFPARLSGKIVLDVEANGEAYYIYPEDLKGYYLGRPADAFNIMRELGLGITNNDLIKINSQEINNAKENVIEDNEAIARTAPDYEILSEAEMWNRLPDCAAEHKYTVLPIDYDEFNEVSPLGGIGPPGHTIPNEHVHFQMHAGESSDNVEPLRTPAGIYIRNVASYPDSFDESRNEYVITFSLCKTLHGYYNHVKDVRGDLQTILDKIEGNCGYNNSGYWCSKDLFTFVPADTVIGGVGHLQGNFDFGTLDYSRQLDFANVNVYGPDNGMFSRPRTTYIACALDYYDDENKNLLYQKLKRTIAPFCGETMQDIKGTLQGNWFMGDVDLASDWDKQLAFLHEAVDPTISVVSIGGVFTDSGKWSFFANSSGFINREFKDVTTDGNIYCYQADNQTGKIIVEMLSDTEIKIEHQEEGCVGSYVFKDSMVYNR